MSWTIEQVKEYWDSHLNCTQFIIDKNLEIGSNQFFKHLEEAINRYQYKINLFQKIANSTQGKDLLEVGCGLGLEMAKLAELGFNVTGIDISPRAIELCNLYLNKKNLNGLAEIQNAEKMNFRDEYFDIVYSSGVLQHTPNIHRSISEIYRVLKPGGKVFIILYHKYSWFNLLQKVSGKNIEFEDKDAPIINSYSKNEVKTLFKNYQNIIVETEYYHPLPTMRKGCMPFVFNKFFVPVMKTMPINIIRKFGWHLVLTANK